MKKLLLVVALAFATPAWAGAEWVQGQVVKLDPARGKVTLQHAPIKSIKMKAMTMAFKVKDTAVLTPLKVGDKVRFEVQEHDGDLVVLRIEPDR